MTTTERRLRSVFLHLSPPLISSGLPVPPPQLPNCSSSSCSTSTPSAAATWSHHFVNPSRTNRGDSALGGDEIDHGHHAHKEGKFLGLECRGPSSDREGKLLENLILSRLRKDYIRQEALMAATSELGLGLLGLEPCGGNKGEGNARNAEKHGSMDLEPCELEDLGGGTGISMEAKWATLEADNGAVEEDEYWDRSSSGHTAAAAAVHAGITSASAIPKDGWGRQGGPPPLLKTKHETESGSPAAARRVATCVFCDIVHGAAPCMKLYEDESCLCILDINPLSFGPRSPDMFLPPGTHYAPGGLLAGTFQCIMCSLTASTDEEHSLVLPKAHYPSLEATPPQIAAAMCAAVPLISSALLAATRCDSFNMLVNSGVAAGQVIFHTHFHIIPRCAGDGLWKSESASRQPLRQVQEAKVLAHLVRTKLSSLTVGVVGQ